MTDFRTEVGFDSGATDAVVKWTDVTPWFVGLNSQAGRSTELNTIETGTASIAFDNADGRFTPGRSTITMLSERFNAFGVAGPDLFTFGSGEWLRSGPLAMSLTSGTSGVTVTAVGAGLSDSVAIRLNSGGVPVVAGQQVTVTVRAKVTCTSALTNYVIKAQYDSAVARDVAASTGVAVTSNGALVTASATFTVPAGATFIRPRLDGFPTSGAVGTLALTAAWIRVDLPNPFAGKLDARNPIRSYTRFDDNHLNLESVNADRTDLNQPRWQGNDPTNPGGRVISAKVITDAIKGDVFDMQAFWVANAATTVQTFDSGIAGDVDVIHVKRGDVVTLDADIQSPGVANGGGGLPASMAVAYTPYDIAEGFESGVSRWIVPPGATFATDTMAGLGGPHSGAVAGVLTVTSGLAGFTVARRVNVLENMTYTMSQWLYTAVGGGVSGSLSVAWTNGAGASLGVDVINSPLPAGIWQQQTGTFTAPPGAVFGDFGPSFSGFPPIGSKFYIDDVTFSATSLLPPNAALGWRCPVATVTSAAAADVWSHLATTYTAPDDGHVRLRVALPIGSMPRARVANAKVRVNGIGTSAVADLSGVAGAFRGFVEKWSATQTGLLGEATATCVDTSSVLNRPLDTAQRAITKTILTTRPNSPSYYWTCVEADTATYTRSVVGDDRVTLKVKPSSSAPQTGGFTTDKTFIYSDGEQSGGFRVVDSDRTKGAALVLADSSTPNFLTQTSFSFTMWMKLDALPPVGDAGRLLFIANNALTGLLSVDVTPDGRLDGRLTDVAGTVVAQATTAAGMVVPGKAQYVYIGFDTGTPNKGHIDIRIDGTRVQATTAVNYGLFLPHTHIQFGGIVAGTLHQYYINGSLNHITLVNGAPPTDAPVGPAPTYMDSIRNINLDRTTFQDVGLVQDEATRINTLLGSLGVPYLGSTSLDTPLSQLIAARWQADESAYTLLANTAGFAGGTWLCRPRGELAYQNRLRRVGVPVRWTLAEHQDGSAWELDEARIANTVTAQRSTGAQRVATDAASVMRYGVKPQTLTRDVVSDDELADAAAYYLSRYKQTQSRCETVIVDASTVNPVTDPDLVGLAFAGGFGDRLTLSGLLPTAPADTIDVFIEGVGLAITLDGGNLNCVATFNVSNAAGSDVWILEDAVSGVLDSASCVTTY